MKNVKVSLDQRRQAKIQCLQHPNQRNLDNLNNVRLKARRDFKKKLPYKTPFLCAHQRVREHF